MKEKNTKRICLLITVILITVHPIQVFAAYEEPSISDNQKPLSMSVTEQSISDIDLLMDRKAEALLNNDQALCNSIDQSLEQQGVTEVSLNEIIELTGSIPPIVSSTQDVSANKLAATSASFQTVYGKYTSGGKTYDIMRVYATPNGRTGSLYQTGVTSVKNTKSMTAHAMKILQMAVTSTAGVASNKIGLALTGYDFFSGTKNELSKTSTITNIQASYTWNTAETCVFVYFKSPTVGGLWNLKGRYSKVSASVGVSVPSITVKGKNASTSVVQKSYQGSAVPVNYNSTEKAFNAYKKGGTYSSMISSIYIRGVEGKDIKNIKLKNPLEPAEIR